MGALALDETIRVVMPTLEEALEEAELQAVKTETCKLDQVLVIAATDCHHPSVTAVWHDTAAITGQANNLFPIRKEASLAIEDSVDPQAMGHALVLAACGGFINCVRRLRDLMQLKHSGSILLGRFNAFAFLKASENGHHEVVKELLRPMPSASVATMGYVIATQWREKEPGAYPFVKLPASIPTKDWLHKLVSTRNMLPAAAPFCTNGEWELKGMPGMPGDLHDCIRAAYSIFMIWRAAVIAASNCHVEVFKVLLRYRAFENTRLVDSFHDTSGPRKSFDHDGKKIISERAKLDTLMYQLVEELSTKNYHDGILYSLWGHIQRGGRDSPKPEAGRPRCVAQATNGLWEMQLEVPLLMMPVEYALQEEEAFRRYKQLTQLFSQRAKVNIQLTASVEALPNCLQIVVGVKHVRFKVENSRWDNEVIGHFPCLVTLSVTPITNEGTGVTMTNSSSNIVVKVGHMERIQVGTSTGDGGNRGLSGGMGGAASVGMTSTMKNKPWRFEQLPLKDERGGSFVWTLQSMKGLMFDRSNPMRTSEKNSKWRFGRRLPSNPLDELPFTSEGGVIFTSNEFDDTMMWRFPKSMEGKKMRWSIEGQIHSTYTTTRYFETRMATFCGDIEEPLKPLEVKDKGGKGGKDEKSEKGERGDKPEKGEKGEKREKGEKGENRETGEKGDKPPEGEDSEKKEKKDKDEDKGEEKTKEANMPENGSLSDPAVQIDPDYQEFLEFKRYKERLRRESVAGQVDLSTPATAVQPKSNEIQELREHVQPGNKDVPMQMAPEHDRTPSENLLDLSGGEVTQFGPVGGQNLIDCSDGEDMEGLVSRSAAQDVLLARAAALEIMRGSELQDTVMGPGMAMSRSQSMSEPGGGGPRLQGPMSVRTRSGKSTDVGR